MWASHTEKSGSTQARSRNLEKEATKVAKTNSHQKPQHTEKGNHLRWCGVDAQADGHINKIKHMMSKIHRLHGSVMYLKIIF